VFAFEINRHGARAPIMKRIEAMDGFKVLSGDLTAVGMR
jgi:hypothetical protein